jgi:putative acetyltransferase
MLIREIKPGDNKQIEAIMRACFEEFKLPIVGSSLEDKDVSKMYEGFQTNKAKYFVVEENNRVVGGGGVKELQGADSKTCELQKMYFEPKARGKGFGKILFDKCISSAKELGYEYCYLESASQLKAAIRLYELNGFKFLDKPLGSTGHVICGVWMLKNLK